MWVMLPLVGLYWSITALRRLLYKLGLKKTITLSVPVIVVGNLTVGGNGKTPVVVWLVGLMQTLGYTVGVISRGYGGDNQGLLLVTPATPTRLCGDEPRLIVDKTNCMMVVGRDRVAAGNYLIEQAKAQHTPLDFIISDDGLQHYRLDRAGELVVIDGKRRFGNGHLLPMGPNREGQWRMDNALLRINNGGHVHVGEHAMSLMPQTIRSVIDNSAVDVDLCQWPTVAMAGIGYPQRFFDTLQSMGIYPEQQHSFEDHQAFEQSDLLSLTNNTQWLIMTEKDAVKCRDFAQPNWCYLPVEAQIDEQATQQLKQKLEELKNGV